jgi:DNA polymerase-3 subunit delta'
VLRLANGAPLAAIEWIHNDILSSRSHFLKMIYNLSQKKADPLQSAVEIQKMDTVYILDFMQSFIMDLLRLHFTIATSEMMNQDFMSELKDLHQRTLLVKITQFQNYLLELQRQLQVGINLNKQLMLETLLIRWMECA